MKKVSIVIPAYNVELFIDRCIKSVSSQTYRNIEVIIIDDGSTDESLKRARSYSKNDPRIIVISQNNSGVSVARNKGIETATGYYITFVDPDDYLEPDAIERMVLLMNNESVDCVRTTWRIVRRKDSSHNVRQSLAFGLYKSDGLKELRYRAAVGDILCYSWIIMVKKEVVNNGNLRFPVGVTMMEDSWFFIDMLNHVKSMFISDIVTYNYVVHEKSAMRSLDGFDDKLNSIVRVNSHITSQMFNENQRKHINAVHASNLVNLTVVNAMRVRRFSDMYRLFEKLHSNVEFQRIYEKASPSKLLIYHRIACWAAAHNNKSILLILVACRRIVGR